MLNIIKRKLIINICFLLLFTNLFSQVGINTTSPQETLHVSGTTRIDDLTPNFVNSLKLTGVDADNVLNEVIVGTNLTLSNGILSASTSATATGSNNMGITFINDNLSTQTFNDYDLDINGANVDKTIFIFTQSSGSAQPFTITGITGGTEGRMIVLKSNQTNLNINLLNESGSSSSINRISLGSNLNINGYGSFTLVYSVVIQRWIMIARTIS